ncbi:MAG: SIR2 family protein [Caldilineaceae bacterium]|nr:SIR2 family protein [Caldilineaceae bacterium]
MIDPIDSLAFSIQANRGVYALLIGSGVSRSAQIPTGWDITLDLIRKLAAAAGESAEPDPEEWYREKYEEDPDYSKLVGTLAKARAERQKLLHPYIEPNDQERGEGIKQPTAAHKAIAWLVAQGFVRVIITTNFDRLIEKALEETGVEPVVISSEDQIQGMVPLVHTQHCLIKLHGDYLDPRIRNTPSELSEYPDEFNQLLDRIFDEFGLIVCGWSAEWDAALRDAMFRAPSRRFTTYWAAYGQPRGEAQRLISHRQAQVIDIQDADRFFQNVQEKVESIEQFSQPHPLSTQAAVASLKRYLPEPRYEIRLSDLIEESVTRVVESVSTPFFDVNSPEPNTETVTERVRAYEAACSTLLAMAATGGRWAKEAHYDNWRRILERLATVPHLDGQLMWLGLQRYPATLVLYALGLGALSTDRLHFLGHILSTEIQTNDETKAVSHLLTPNGVFKGFHLVFNSPREVMQILEGMKDRHTPLSDWIHEAMRQHIGNTAYNSEQFDSLFDKLEILMALSYAYHDDKKAEPWYRYWTPLGRYVWRFQTKERILREIEESISTHQHESLYVTSDLFGETPEECAVAVQQFREFVVGAAQSMRIYW